MYDVSITENLAGQPAKSPWLDREALPGAAMSGNPACSLDA